MLIDIALVYKTWLKNHWDQLLYFYSWIYQERSKILWSSNSRFVIIITVKIHTEKIIKKNS